MALFNNQNIIPDHPQSTRISIDLSKTPPQVFNVKGDYLELVSKPDYISLDDIKIKFDHGEQYLTAKDLPIYRLFTKIIVSYPTGNTGEVVLRANYKQYPQTIKIVNTTRTLLREFPTTTLVSQTTATGITIPLKHNDPPIGTKRIMVLNSTIPITFRTILIDGNEIEDESTYTEYTTPDNTKDYMFDNNLSTATTYTIASGTTAQFLFMLTPETKGYPVLIRVRTQTNYCILYVTIYKTNGDFTEFSIPNDTSGLKDYWYMVNDYDHLILWVKNPSGVDSALYIGEIEIYNLNKYDNEYKINAIDPLYIDITQYRNRHIFLNNYPSTQAYFEAVETREPMLPDYAYGIFEYGLIPDRVDLGDQI